MGVCGPVGSGKSSFLQALISEVCSLISFKMSWCFVRFYCSYITIFSKLCRNSSLSGGWFICVFWAAWTNTCWMLFQHFEENHCLSKLTDGLDRLEQQKIQTLSTDWSVNGSNIYNTLTFLVWYLTGKYSAETNHYICHGQSKIKWNIWIRLDSVDGCHL